MSYTTPQRSDHPISQVTVWAGLLTFSLMLAAPQAHSEYRPLDQQCDGLPQLPVGSIPGTCVGLLANSDTSFVKPRKALQVPGTTKLLVTDLGSWSGGGGTLWLLDFYGPDGFKGPFRSHRLATGLTLPHDIKHGPDGAFYLGEANRIQRFQLKGNEMIAQENVVTGLPSNEQPNRHPLSVFVFLPNNDLLVNIGSRTDDRNARQTPYF